MGFSQGAIAARARSAIEIGKTSAKIRRIRNAYFVMILGLQKDR